MPQLPPRVDTGPALAAAGLVHRVRVPPGTGPHPTVVMLHGMGGDEDVMWLFAASVPPDWLIVAPRAMHPNPEGGYAWHPRRRDEWPPLERFDDAVAAIDRLIDALPVLYGADPARMHLMGFSQGAATAYATALRHPGRIVAIAGLVGFVPPVGEADPAAVVASRPLAGVPVFVAAGRRDPLIPLDRARAGAEVLREAGAVLAYHEYDVGHKLAAAGMRDLAMWWRGVVRR